MDEGDQKAQISTSFFPPPPQVYAKFTPRNLELLQALQDHLAQHPEPGWDEWELPKRIEKQNDILKQHLETQEDQSLPDFDLLLELRKPNMHWIEQDGGYTVFGQTWPIPDVTPTLEELGIPVLYPPDQADRKQLLVTLLRTLLHTYRSLTSDLLQPAQPYDVWSPAGFWTQSTPAKDRLKHIESVVINMQFLINELRPTQAKETLKLVMQTQLERRRAETEVIKTRCAEMRRKLEQLKRIA